MDPRRLAASLRGLDRPSRERVQDYLAGLTPDQHSAIRGSEPGSRSSPSRNGAVPAGAGRRLTRASIDLPRGASRHPRWSCSASTRASTDGCGPARDAGRPGSRVGIRRSAHRPEPRGARWSASTSSPRSGPITSSRCSRGDASPAVRAGRHPGAGRSRSRRRRTARPGARRHRDQDRPSSGRARVSAHDRADRRHREGLGGDPSARRPPVRRVRRGRGTRRLVERFIVHPNEIKRLRTGEAVVITKLAGGRPGTVRIEPPRRPPTPGLGR